MTFVTFFSLCSFLIKNTMDTILCLYVLQIYSTCQCVNIFFHCCKEYLIFVNPFLCLCNMNTWAVVTSDGSMVTLMVRVSPTARSIRSSPTFKAHVTGCPTLSGKPGQRYGILFSISEHSFKGDNSLFTTTFFHDTEFWRSFYNLHLKKILYTFLYIKWIKYKKTFHCQIFVSWKVWNWSLKIHVGSLAKKKRIYYSTKIWIIQ